MCADPLCGYGAVFAIATAWGVGRTAWSNARDRRATRRRKAATKPVSRPNTPPAVQADYRREVVKWGLHDG